jgi:hypothetical protein
MRVPFRRGRAAVLGARALAIVALLIVSACATTVTSIKTLLDDAPHFDRESVRITGEVERPIGALGLGAYQLNDGTGTLRVVSESGGAPRAGAHVCVEGTFRSAFSLGDESLAVIVEKRRSSP